MHSHPLPSTCMHTQLLHLSASLYVYIPKRALLYVSTLSRFPLYTHTQSLPMSASLYECKPMSSAFYECTPSPFPVRMHIQLPYTDLCTPSFPRRMSFLCFFFSFIFFFFLPLFLSWVVQTQLNPCNVQSTRASRRHGPRFKEIHNVTPLGAAIRESRHAGKKEKKERSYISGGMG